MTTKEIISDLGKMAAVIASVGLLYIILCLV